MSRRSEIYERCPKAQWGAEGHVNEPGASHKIPNAVVESNNLSTLIIMRTVAWSRSSAAGRRRGWDATLSGALVLRIRKYPLHSIACSFSD